MMRISNAAARFTTSRPMLPRPTMPSVFPRSSVPRNLRFSHLPDLVDALACEESSGPATSIRASVCSATDTALPPGVFITSTPAAVAAGSSTLSTPTPARPITRSLGAAASKRRGVHPDRAPHNQRVGVRKVRVVFFRIRNDDFPAGLLLQRASQPRPASGSAIRICMSGCVRLWPFLSPAQHRRRRSGRPRRRSRTSPECPLAARMISSSAITANRSGKSK